MVLAYIARLIGPVDAEEVRQQVFLEVWQVRARFDPALRLEPWILDIARKRSIDHLRRQSRSQREIDAVTAAAASVDIDEFLTRFVDSSAIRDALAALSEVERESRVLAYFGQLSQVEIAARLEVPLGTVNARVFRGLRSLSMALLDDEERE